MKILLAILFAFSMNMNAKNSNDIYNKSNSKNEIDKTSEEALWHKANQLFKQSNYSKAAKILMQIEELYPSSSRIKDVLFLASKSFLLCKQYKKAIEAAELLKELDASYKEHSIDDVLIQSYYALLRSPERENPTLRMTLALADKHPKKYHRIRQKCIDILAYADLKTGLLYAKKDNYIISLKYYGNIIREYKESAFTSEAYFRCVEIFHHLGLTKDKNQCIKILAIKYSKSEWYQKAIGLKDGGSKCEKIMSNNIKNNSQSTINETEKSYNVYMKDRKDEKKMKEKEAQKYKPRKTKKNQEIKI
ncbi:outer membrane protein assembly factor BamD [Candidatus Cytomitobacter indipagum]|uniref:Outer membrane protein assembly factor BamD n=1 Tax=Candidatus Cytomitobacter indipagum TaxID=2601575 RepID=A0A5C0UDL3_9PROT|nr:outer membrane protein assembly factor BamD [Candidatus Cytomitobacter indipagum]QEK38078.1 outer membrane protein assembly factor BamD [Candidatus Cytomitobacter indipagum]